MKVEQAQQELDQLEGRFGVDRTAFETSESLSNTIRKVLSPLPVGQQAVLVSGWMMLLKLDPTRSPAHATMLGELWLGVHGCETTTKALSLGPYSSVASNAQCMLIHQLASSLNLVDGRGPAAALHLIEKAVPFDIADPRSIERSTWIDVEVCHLVDLIGTYAQCADGYPLRSTRALMWAAYLIQLPPSSLENRKKLRARIANHHLLLADQAHDMYGLILAYARMISTTKEPGVKGATNLLECWLGWGENDYENSNSMSQAIDRWGPFLELPALSQSNVVVCLSDLLHKCSSRSSGHALVLLEAWLNWTEDDYGTAERLSNAMSRHPFAGLDPLNKLQLIARIADGLRLSDSRATQQATNLLEQSIEYLNQPGRDTYTIELKILTSWMLTLPKGDPRRLAYSRLAVERIRSIRPGVADRDAFRNDIVLVKRCIQIFGLDWVSDVKGGKREKRALEIMSWMEDLENRSILERLDRQVEPTALPTEMQDAAELKAWPIAVPDSPPADDYFRDGYRPACTPSPFNTKATSLHHAAARSRPAPLITLIERIKPNSLANSVTRPRDLPEMIPNDAVWLRVLFGHDGQLVTWAWRRKPGLLWRNRLQLVAAWSSARKARRDLAKASMQFEMINEVVWSACDGMPRWLRTAVERARKGGLQDFCKRCVTEFAGYERYRIRSLRANRHGSTAPGVATPTLLEGCRLINEGGLDQHEFVEFIGPVWDLLQEGVGLVSDVSKEEWRRISLDRANDRYVACLDGVWSLQPLWQQVEDADWARMDIMLTLQSSLWCAPISRMSFGDSTFGEKTRSISLVPSMTMRTSKVTSETDTGEGRKRVLSCQWLPHSDRERSDCLARLHRGLQLLDGLPDSGYQVSIFGLADNPPATPEKLDEVLSVVQPQLAVLAGHGASWKTGITLSGGVWPNEHSQLDMLNALILVSCSLGYMEHEIGSDVTGLAADILAKGVRAVVASRWTVADNEAATLFVELVSQILSKGIAASDFETARVLADTRRFFGRHVELGVSQHTMSLFDVFT